MTPHTEFECSAGENVLVGRGRVWSLALFLALSFLVILTVVIGVVPTRMYGHDLFLGLDGGWRVLCGQRPHVDFFTGLGPISPMLVGLGIFLAGGTATGIGYANALVGLVLALWSYGIARRRMPMDAVGVLTIYVYLLAATPVPIGEKLFSFSHAMFYTRWSFALLAIVLFEALTVDGDKSGTWTQGGSTGAALAALFFLKGNMFLIGFGLAAPSFAVRFQRTRAKGLFLGAAAVALPILAYMGFGFRSMWHDYRLVAAARAHSSSLASILGLATNHLSALCSLLAIAFMVAFLQRSEAKVNGVYWPLMALAVFVAGVLSLATNWQRSGMPLNGAFALVAGVRLSNKVGLYKLSWKRVLIEVGVVGSLALAVLPIFADAAQFGMALAVKYVIKSEVTEHFAARPLAPYITYGGPQADHRPVDGVFLVDKVNDGIALLSAQSKPSESVVTLDFVNPFSFALGRRPSRGSADFLDYGANFNDQIGPDPRDLIGNADLVMVPKNPNLEKYKFVALMRNYGPYLMKNFGKVAESRQWILYRNKFRTPTSSSVYTGGN